MRKTDSKRLMNLPKIIQLASLVISKRGKGTEKSKPTATRVFTEEGIQ